MQEFASGQAGVGVRIFSEIADTRPGESLAGIHAENAGCSRRRLGEAEQDMNGGGFPGAIGPDKTEYLPLFDAERKVLERPDRALARIERHTEAGNIDGRFHGTLFIDPGLTLEPLFYGTGVYFSENWLLVSLTSCAVPRLSTIAFNVFCAASVPAFKPVTLTLTTLLVLTVPIYACV